jgi:hypothetical protein
MAGGYSFRVAIGANHSPLFRLRRWTLYVREGSSGTGEGLEPTADTLEAAWGRR